MSINKDLNVDPYYDDFDETKQFNRVLFKPSRAVQARELTQLQTILQKQVERFGSNVYKEGTIISGINLTSRSDLKYIKLQDQVGFTDPSIYDEFEITDTNDVNFGSTSRFILEGQSSNIRAEIVKGLGGFETQAPNLKTFFINYLNANLSTGQKQFIKGEKLNLLKPDNGSGVFEQVKVDNVAVSFTADNSNDEYAGDSFGVSCEEGVIYQKGHFVFVERQLVIVSRYSNTPENVSVGFTVKENIIDSNLDASLLDNATGFNNQNAPGADRLQLVPVLTSVATESEPAEFFALIRYVDGNPTRLRNFTEFNVIGDEFARRTYEESGNYVVNGLGTSLNHLTTGTGLSEVTVPQAEIQPGKAYVFGREVTNVSTKKITIEPVTTTKTKLAQITSVNYGQYFTFNGSAGQAAIDFAIQPNVTYPKFALYAGTTSVGTCNISNVEPGRIYVFNIVKTQNTAPTHLLPHAVTTQGGFNINTATKVALTNGGELFEQSKGCYIFDAGQKNLNSISNTSLVERAKTSTSVDLLTADRVVTISATDGSEESGVGATQPIADVNTIFAIANNQIYPATDVNLLSSPNSQGFVGMTVEFGAGAPTQAVVHYQRTVKGTSADTLNEATGMIYTKYNLASKRATLGVPNCLQLVSVGLTDPTEGRQTSDADIIDITSRFRLVNNQTDTHYDYSYIQLKSGAQAVPDNAILLVEFKYLERNSANGVGYLTPSSYANVTSLKHLINDYSSRNLDLFNLLGSYDMRPYKQRIIDPGTSRADAGSASGPGGGTIEYSDSIGGEVLGKTIFANSATISSTYDYTLSRIDAIVLNEYGEIQLVKGDEAEAPLSPKLNRQYAISNIIIPGNTIDITGSDPITILDRKNKTYTMKDIEELEMKVESLSNLVQLSLAELQAKSLIIRNSDGNERFKNGILVDKFQSFIGAQLFDPEFNAAVDETRTVAMPAIREFPVDLKVDPASTILPNANVSTESTGFDDVVTLVPDATKVNIMSQPYATNFRSCVSNYYSYQGQADIYPKFSSNRDVIQNPAVNFDIDLQGPLLDLVDGIQEFMPLSREGERIGEPRLLSTTARRERVTTSGGRRGSRTRTRTVVRRNFEESVEMHSLTASPRTEEQTFGNFVTDVRMKPYLPATAIRIFVAGLRPNTRHYFFFDERDVNDDIIPLKDLAKYNTIGRRSGARHQTGRYRFRSNRIARRVKGTAVYSNSKGQLRAVFEMPAGKYFVGENDLEIVDVDQYGSIESASTSYAKATYRGYNFALNKSEINVTTRTVDFDVTTSVIERQFQTMRIDPIAQTFKVKSADTSGANFTFISDIDVFFKRKDTSVGVTLQLREVANGYPTSKVLPFGSKHLESQDVNVSASGTDATKFTFDNPVRLKADTEYCFVVIPDGNSPEYLIFTAKVGSTSLSKGTAVSQLPVVNDWGDGVLFTSTNDSAWKSYQDEDIKFSLNRYNFSESSGTVDLIPNDVEYLTLRENVKKIQSTDTSTGAPDTRRTLHFQNDESVYILSPNASTVGATVQAGELTVLRVNVVLDGSFPFTVGDYLYVVANDDEDEKIVAQIESLADGATVGTTDITIDTPFFSTGSVDIQLCVYGEVSYYNPRNESKIHLKNSSARSGNFIDNLPNSVFSTGESGFKAGKTYTITNLGDAGPNRTTAWNEVGVPVTVTPQVGTIFVATGTGDSATLPGHNGTARENSHKIYGISSGAEATITSTDIQKFTYFQSEVAIDETTNTSTKIELFKRSGVDLIIDKPIEKGANSFCLDATKGITSKSERLRTGASEDFVVRVSLNNNAFKAVTPVIDAELSSINAYEYKITDDEDNTSTWISKEVILKDELPAEGLKVQISAYRPAGTVLDVYSRFVRKENTDIKSNWEQLVLSNPKEFSTPGNLYDYRDYEYDLTESATPPKYNTFQLKVVLRHSTSAELSADAELRNLTPDINLFPHIYSMTAIAVTG